MVPIPADVDLKTGKADPAVDLGGKPEFLAADGQGKAFINLEDKDQIAVVDAAALKPVARYELAGKGGGPGGLALDDKHHILFAACHEPATMVILNADDGKIISTVPIGKGVDGAAFNPDTMEAFSSQGDGTLTITKENSPTSFVVSQNLETKRGARTMTLDGKTNRIFTITGEFTPPPPGERRGQMVPGSFSIVVIGK
jgi:DNA-binding beta-propeller fold protein YncE